MIIRQGDIFWVDLGLSPGSAPAYRHPHLVIQNNLFNQSKINTVGNLLLSKGEANLKKQSVVSISQIVTVDKADLVEKIGTLAPARMKQVIEGIKLLLEPREV